MGEGRRDRDPECIFCRIVAGEIPSMTVHADDRVVAIRDIAPRSPTHILLLSREHIPSADDLTPEDGDLLADVYTTAAGIARTEGIADRGYRVVTNVGEWGGQTVPHLHFHLMGGRSFSWPPG
ncbi:MAG TPA: histidine triad nucleotide-binding protein [Candidatus Limnocylindrales bacterium]